MITPLHLSVIDTTKKIISLYSSIKIKYSSQAAENVSRVYDNWYCNNQSKYSKLGKIVKSHHHASQAEYLLPEK